MGVFPYQCQRCGGGYYRCGNIECAEGACGGSLVCWETRLYFEVIPHPFNDEDITRRLGGEVLTGHWNGTEIMPDHIWRLSNFHEFHTMEPLMTRTIPCVLVNVWCESCFEKTFPIGKKADYEMEELLEVIDNS